MQPVDAALCEDFRKMGRNPDSWLSTALMLKQVTESIWPPPAFAATEDMDHLGNMDIWPVGLMIAGYALESLAKGLQVAKDPTLVTDDGKLTHDFASHGLEKHLGRAGIKLDKEENKEKLELIQRLDAFILWAGRYPIPKNPGKYAPQGGKPLISTSDPRLFRQLFARLSQQLEANIRSST
jgi:hypothetical protein